MRSETRAIGEKREEGREAHEHQEGEEMEEEAGVGSRRVGIDAVSAPAGARHGADEL
jgi:hypothetical protein